MRATLSILGLYQYDNSIFDDIALPTTDHLNKEDLIQNLLSECAELETIYPRPDVFKVLMKHWSNSRLHVWQELADTMDYEYNPIWNKDVHDIEEIDFERNLKSKYQDSASNSTSGNTVNQGVAYNSGSFEDRTKDIATGSMSSNDNSTTDDTGTTNQVRDLVSQGNQGVTSTQQLIKEQREIVNFSLYDIIISEFKTRFCLLVY